MMFRENEKTRLRLRKWVLWPLIVAMQEGGIIQGEGESRRVIDLPPSLVKQIYQTDNVLNPFAFGITSEHRAGFYSWR